VNDLHERLRANLEGRYAIERELGRGGMATVYLARDVRHDRPVALKVLHPDLSHALGPERFQREIRMAARLQHPHILTVHDSGEIPGQTGAAPILWFTMPFVEGESLRDRLRRERQLPLEDALRITREAAQALQYAHEHDVVHRDVKPENLLLTRDGNTLVADFGIARALGGAWAGGQETALTQTGMSIGTPAYMSPEQASGERGIDARTDVYALGCVLYEMLAGEPPYTGATAQQILVKRFTDPVPSVRGVRPSVPDAVDQAIRTALAPIPADRFPGAAQLAAALHGPAAATPVSMPAVAAPAPMPNVPQPATASARSQRRRVPIAALALGLGFLIGLGVLFAWRENHAEAGAATSAKRVAVLPFENLGDTADAYFADGITDAVRGKLTSLPGMYVTASNSSNQYRATTKTPQEIGRELGVDYLLVGKVRWAKGKDGASRVQVSPELIEVGTARATWQQPFDAGLTDVFKVQGDIAGQVAAALDIALGASQQKALAERPTANLSAYDAYLKGTAARAQGSGPIQLRQAVNYFERAVALDSTFAAAWAALSESGSLLYVQGTPVPSMAEQARSAAERALALAPTQPEGYRALGDYYRRLITNADRAIEQYRKGLAIAPANADLLRVLALAEQARGEWEPALEHIIRSRSLDPRSVLTADVVSQTLLWLRRYPEAIAASDRALALEPSALNGIETKAMAYLAQGDLTGARQVLAQPPGDVDLPTFVAYMGTYYDLYWALDERQQALLRRLTAGPFDGDLGVWGLALAGAYEVHGDMKRARAYADSARIAFEQQLKAAPEDAQRLVLLGVALAYLGRRDEAIKAGERGLALRPPSQDASNGPYLQHQLARIFILLGEPEKALDNLEPLLRIPYYLSPGWLKIDPTFDPLRKHPRFQRLVDQAPSS
jgi:serine/threonine-protein kinase